MQDQRDRKLKEIEKARAIEEQKWVEQFKEMASEAKERALKVCLAHDSAKRQIAIVA